MALSSIRYLIQWVASVDLLLIWKHKYSLTLRGNLVVFRNSTCAIGSVVFNGVKLWRVDVS